MSLTHCLVLTKQTRELVRNVLCSKDVLGFHSCTIYQRTKAAPSTRPLPTLSVKSVSNTSRGFSTHSPLRKKPPTAPPPLDPSEYVKDPLPLGTPYQTMEQFDLALPPDVHNSVPSWTSRDDPVQLAPAKHWTDPPDPDPEFMFSFPPGPIHIEEFYDIHKAPYFYPPKNRVPFTWDQLKKRLTRLRRPMKLRKWRRNRAHVKRELKFSPKARDKTTFPKAIRQDHRLRERLSAFYSLPSRELNPWARTPSPQELRELEAIKSSLAPPTPEFSRVPNTKGQKQWNSQVICDELSAWARAGDNPSTFYAKEPEASRALKMLAALQSPQDITGSLHSKNESIDDSADRHTQSSGGSEPKTFPSFPHSTPSSLLQPSFSPLQEEPEPDMQTLLAWAESESEPQDPALENELRLSPSESYTPGPLHVWVPPQQAYTAGNVYHSPYRAPLSVGLVEPGEYVRGASPLRVPLPPMPSYARGVPRKPLVLPTRMEDKSSNDLPRKSLVLVNKARNPPRMPIVLGEPSVDTQVEM